jgi:hypothetical protein
MLRSDLENRDKKVVSVSLCVFVRHFGGFMGLMSG